MARRRTAAICSWFENLTDPRVERTKRHLLLDMVVIALCATICGAEGWADVERFGKAKRDWFARFLELPNGIPSHDTMGRVFARLDTAQFLACLHNWLQSMNLDLKERGIAIDGKTLRRSFDKGSGKSALHVVSAWASGLRLCLGQVAVDDKSNEITAVPKLLELLELTGAVVTVDAMHCQRETAAAIRARGADYIFTVKQNQPTLCDELSRMFSRFGERGYQKSGVRTWITNERSHGRTERREYHVAPVPADWRLRHEWMDVRSVGMIHRYRQCGDKVHEEAVFVISSLPPKVKRIAEKIRGHWGIENSLHWVLDVTFSEDSSRIRKGDAPEIASIFRRLALNVLQRDTSVKSSIRGKRLLAGWNVSILEQILTSFSSN